MSGRVGRITVKQFLRAVENSRLSPAARNAAECVMVHGVGYSEAAKTNGMLHRQQVYGIVNSIRRRMMALTRQRATKKPTTTSSDRSKKK